MLDRLRDIYEEHTQKVWLVAAIILAVVIGIYMITLESSEERASKGIDNATLDLQVAQVQDLFSELSTASIGYSEQYPAFEITLFLKKPFVTKGDFDSALYSYVELLKYKWNDDSLGRYVSGVRFKIYDRIENYEANINPRATAEYRLTTVDEKIIEEYSDMLLTDLIWQETLEPEEAPDYTQYTFPNSFSEFTLDRATAFSHQEYALLKKLLLYQTLADGSRGIDAFMFWELGIPPTTTEFIAYKDLTDFMRIASDYGENLNLYDGIEDEMFEQYAKENPRLLAYILTNKVYDLKLDAKKALVAHNRDFYLDVYIREAQEMVASLGEEEGWLYMEELDELQSTAEQDDLSSDTSEFDYVEGELSDETATEDDTNLTETGSH